MTSVKYWGEIEDYEWKDVVKIQEKKLQDQLRYVISNSEFYKKKFADINIDKIRKIEDLKNLPFTHKEEIRKSFKEKPPFGVMVAAPKEKIISISCRFQIPIQSF